MTSVTSEDWKFYHSFWIKKLCCGNCAFSPPLSHSGQLQPVADLDPNSNLDDGSLAGRQCSCLPHPSNWFLFWLPRHQNQPCFVKTFFSEKRSSWPLTVGSCIWHCVSTKLVSDPEHHSSPCCNLNKAQGLHNLLGIDWSHPKFHLVQTLSNHPNQFDLSLAK